MAAGSVTRCRLTDTVEGGRKRQAWGWLLVGSAGSDKARKSFPGLEWRGIADGRHRRSGLTDDYARHRCNVCFKIGDFAVKSKQDSIDHSPSASIYLLWLHSRILHRCIISSSPYAVAGCNPLDIQPAQCPGRKSFNACM